MALSSPTSDRPICSFLSYFERSWTIVKDGGVAVTDSVTSSPPVQDAGAKSSQLSDEDMEMLMAEAAQDQDDDMNIV
jgi:predicted O-methyltransferase YrrM